MQRGLLAIGTGGPRQNDSQSFLEMGTDLTPKVGTFGENHVAGKQQVLTFFAAPKPGGFALRMSQEGLASVSKGMASFFKNR